MSNRPNTFQHDDYHPANLLIHQGRYSGIIDFGRMDWGDPIHDFHKIGFFSAPISVKFSKGITDGYFGGEQVPEQFWHLYALYSAMHIVSAIVWGKRFGHEMEKRLFALSMNVLHDHDYFTRTIPKWYKD